MTKLTKFQETQILGKTREFDLKFPEITLRDLVEKIIKHVSGLTTDHYDSVKNIVLFEYGNELKASFRG